MPIMPTTAKMSGDAVKILNAIRNGASANYRDYVPVADASQESIRAIGAVIMDYDALKNEFLNALVNRIGRVIITSRLYRNPWAVFKKGILEYGETIEEIFVNIARPFEYDVETAEKEVFKREIPDVRAGFHVLNYKKFYKATIQDKDLRLAFLSWSGITDLIAKIVDAMYTGANYDEFQTMKYMLARHILDGHLYAKDISDYDTTAGIVTAVKGISNNLEYLSTNYNLAGVATNSDKSRQYIIVNADFDAAMNVEVLATAFNMDKAEFMGHRVMIDSFGTLDNTRLAQLFADDDNYTEISAEEKAVLDAIPAVLVDEDWFMIFDNLQNFTEQYNGQGMYWNYWYHVWKTFSISPFANAVVFVPGEPEVVSVTISPDSATASAGQVVLLTATVVATNFAPKGVIWSSDDETIATVDAFGKVTVSADATAEDTVDITATSVFDSTAYDTITITVA